MQTTAQARKEFFSVEQPCLRASPLPKQYGWGFIFDDEGRVALCLQQSPEYKKLMTSKAVPILKAMRSGRAR
jgi:hypothetical protein